MTNKIIIGVVLAVILAIIVWYRSKAKVSGTTPGVSSSPSPSVAKPGVVPATTSTPKAATPQATSASQAALTKILRAKKWNVGGSTWTGDYLKIEVLPDGSVKIGSGYRGTLVDMDTIITKERNGQVSSEISWKAEAPSTLTQKVNAAILNTALSSGPVVGKGAVPTTLIKIPSI